MFDDTNLSVNPLAVLKPTKEPRLFTLAEYLRREERSQELHEYNDGIITKLPMALGPHNEITMNIASAIKIAVKLKSPKYRIFGAQQLIYMSKLNISRYPDVLVVSEAPVYHDDNQQLMINPILIIEVLSKSTKTYDRTNKFDEYKTLDSFCEYLLIDQKKCHIERRFREEPDLWRDTFFTDITQSIHLKSINCTLELSDIYENITLK